jgi:hypothetical protein
LELRSSVVKDITALVSHIALMMGDDFEPLADYFLPVLLKNTYVTKKVISDSSHDCIKTIIVHTRINKCISELVQCLSSKKRYSTQNYSNFSHKVLRQRSIEYICLLLESKTTKYLDAHIPLFEKSIKDTLDFDNKEAGKKTFFEFQKHFPEQAKK